jgi:hypothetical protein
MFNNFIFSENSAVYEIMWKNSVEPGRPHMTIWCLRIACWLPKSTNTNSEYVILVAFPRQQWMHERVCVFRYTYTARLVTNVQDCLQPHYTHKLLLQN